MSARTPQPLSYGDGFDPPGCPAGPDCSCCGPRTIPTYRDRLHEAHGGTGAPGSCPVCAATLQDAEERALLALRDRALRGLDEVCSGRRHCNGTPTERCCGEARCDGCHREHRTDCGDLQDEVRRELFPDGCDCTANKSVCPVHRAYVEEEIRRRLNEECR